MKKVLKFTDIVIIPELQHRETLLNEPHVKDLCIGYTTVDAQDIPPPVVFDLPEKGKVLVAGFNRMEAMGRCGMKQAEFDVREGTWADAVVFAAMSNNKHGLKRTGKEKRNSVRMILDVHPEWTDRLIADRAQVNNHMVATVRAELEPDPQVGVSPNPPKEPVSPEKSKAGSGKRVGKDGKTYGGKDPTRPYTKDDGIKTLPGVYTPRYVRAEGKKHEVVLDAHDNPVPDQVGDRFADPRLRSALEEMIEAAEAFDTAYDSVTKLGRSSSFPFVDLAFMQKTAKQLRGLAIEATDHLREAVPMICCPVCHGGNPRGCHGKCRKTGYIPAGLYHLDPAFRSKKRK